MDVDGRLIHPAPHEQPPLPRRPAPHARAHQAAQAQPRRIRPRQGRPRARAHVHRARGVQRDVERALLVQVARASTCGACPPRAPRVIQGPGENAGVVDIGDGFAAVFKMESHNHPRFIEPYQGAATGVGGILRDVFTMGARPIAGLELTPLRPARSPAHARAPPRRGRRHRRLRQLHRRAHRGRRGAVRRALRRQHPGQRLHLRRGPHRSHLLRARDRRRQLRSSTSARRPAATASTARPWPPTSSRRAAPAQRPTMQVGDPFMGKLLLEACLELFRRRRPRVGIQDMGAAGLTSSSVEMAGRAKNGIELDLDKVPRRAKRMTPYEILLSESQERMLLVAKPGREQEVLADLRAAGSSTRRSSARSPTPGAG